tara:strand:- start:1852 stop:3477 length:1626 start_codon:yes stop_codon:yes gene_type:complete
MKKAILLLVLLKFIFSSCSNRVDLLVHNAKVYTVNKNFDIASAFVVKNGKFIEVGGEDLINKYKPANIVDARGLPIYPGFIDSHCDLFGLGSNKFKVNINRTNSVDQAIRLLKEHQVAYGQKFLHGIGWEKDNWELNLSSLKKLSESFPDIPVILERTDKKVLIANNKALEIANIDEITRIDGVQTILKNEDLTDALIVNATQLLDKLRPKLSRKEEIEALIKAQEICFENGLTTIDQVGVTKEKILLIDSLQKRDLIKLRIYSMILNDSPSMEYFFKIGGIKNNLLNVNSVEVKLDGFLSEQTVSLKEDYNNLNYKNSKPFINKDSLYALADILIKNSFQMNVRASGDSANEMVLETYNLILSDLLDPRWRIESAQLISEEDISKINSKIIPSIQPINDIGQIKSAKSKLDAERLKNAFAYKDLLDWSGVLALGSNFTNEMINPLNTFFAAVNRRLNDEKSQEGFQMKNSLSRYEALLGMTRWAAYANFEENEKGSIESGKLADFVFLDRDIMTIDMNEVLRARVVATILNGKIVYSNRL